MEKFFRDFKIEISFVISSLKSRLKKPSIHGLALFFGLIFLSLLVFYQVKFSPPDNFPEEKYFSVEEGMTFGDIALALKNNGYIRSERAMKFVARGMFWNERGAMAGDYFFDKPIGVFSVTKRIVTGNFDLRPIKITIPEGLTKFETAELLSKKLPHFDKEKFILESAEGYLFPDTYFMIPSTNQAGALKTIDSNFANQISQYQLEIDEFINTHQNVKKGMTLDDIIVMASIVETEARKFETRQTIAGILWKRIEIGMPLQVDVSFKYINGKGTSELTLDDLEIDSKYNTYKYVGLPPTAIANPGIDSILATIRPIKTDYLYFLSDHDGEMHYAATFDQHKLNKEKYLW